MAQSNVGAGPRAGPFSQILRIPKQCHASEGWHPESKIKPEDIISLDASLRWHDSF